VKNEALKKPPVKCKYICGNFDKWIRRIAEWYLVLMKFI
jgi:hypothetical protein